MKIDVDVSGRISLGHTFWQSLRQVVTDAPTFEELSQSQRDRLNQIAISFVAAFNATADEIMTEHRASK
jgi:hypothetical protein